MNHSTRPRIASTINRASSMRTRVLAQASSCSFVRFVMDELSQLIHW